METRIVIKFKHDLEPGEMTIQERKLMTWLKANDYKGPFIAGSLMFNELTVSWGWGNDMQPYENGGFIIRAHEAIRDLFGPLVETG